MSEQGANLSPPVFSNNKYARENGTSPALPGTFVIGENRSLLPADTIQEHIAADGIGV